MSICFCSESNNICSARWLSVLSLLWHFDSTYHTFSYILHPCKYTKFDQINSYRPLDPKCHKPQCRQAIGLNINFKKQMNDEW